MAKLELSPVHIRLAYTYLKKGIGTYAIHFGPYTDAKVEELEAMDPLASSHLGLKYGAIWRVSFFDEEGTMLRYVDFVTLASGGTIVPLLTEVKNES